jgi:hypothetical protein
MFSLYVEHMNCYGMWHCLCSGLVEVILILQVQHINNRKYTVSYIINGDVENCLCGFCNIK